MFSKYVFFQKRAPKQKGGCLDTMDTPWTRQLHTGRTSTPAQCRSWHAIPVFENTYFTFFRFKKRDFLRF